MVTMELLMKQSHISRAVTAASTVALTGLVLTGCAAPTAESDTLVIGVPVGEGGSDTYSDMLEDFLEANPGVDAELREYPVDGFSSAMRTQLQAGNAPGVLYVNPGSGSSRSVLSLVEGGYLRPVTDLVDIESIPETEHAYFSADGEVWAQPTVINPTGIVVNKSAMDADGVEFPETFEEVLAVCEQAADAGKSFLVMAGGEPDGNNDIAVALAGYLVYGPTPDWNELRDAGETDFASSEEWNSVLDYYAQLRDARCFQDGVEGAGFDVISSRLAQGTSYASFIPAGAAGDLEAQAPGSEFVIEVLPNPTGGEPVLMASVDGGFAITTSGNEEASRAFIEWFGQKEVLAQHAVDANALPLVTEAGAEILPQYAPVLPLLESGNVIDNRTQGWSNEVYMALSNGVQGLFTGQATEEEVLAELDALWQP